MTQSTVQIIKSGEKILKTKDYYLALIFLEKAAPLLVTEVSNYGPPAWQEFEDQMRSVMDRIDSKSYDNANDLELELSGLSIALNEIFLEINYGLRMMNLVYDIEQLVVIQRKEDPNPPCEAPGVPGSPEQKQRMEQLHDRFNYVSMEYMMATEYCKNFETTIRAS